MKTLAILALILSLPINLFSRDSSSRRRPAPARRGSAAANPAPQIRVAPQAPSAAGGIVAPPKSRPRRVGADPEPAPAPEPGFSNPVPGALIRTEGLGAKTAPAAPAPRLHAVEAGERVSPEDGRAQVLNPHKGLQIGPKDTLPPPSPGTVSGGRASGRTAITANPSAGDSGGHNRDQGGRPDDPNR